MRLLILMPALAWAAFTGCGGPPDFVLRDFEIADQRFQSPSPPEGRDTVDAILKKQELTLEDVLSIADILNPTLASERRNVDLATAAIWDAKLYPNPSIGVEVEEYGGSFSESKRVASVTIPIVASGRIGSATDAAVKERQVTALHFVWQRREFLNEVKRAFIHVLATRRAEELARETRDIAKSLHDVTNERFKAQAVPEMELLKAAVNLATAESELKRAESGRAIAVKALHARMGDVNFPKDRFVGTLAVRFTVPSLQALRGQIGATHPLAEAVRASREAAELQVAAAKAAAFPDIEFSFGAGKDVENDSIIEGGLGVPLPLFNRNQGAILAAETRLRQAELQTQAVKNDLQFMLEESYRTFLTALDRAQVYQDEILPKAQKALDQTNEGYRLGKFGYLDVLDAQRTLSESRSAFAAALEDLNFSAADLEKLTGTRLEALK